jgi:hypothetical protein
MAAGGHMLLANNPEKRRRPLSFGETVAALARALHLPV